MSTKTTYFKLTSIFVMLLFGYQIFFPTLVAALTGGPSQPEVESFQSISVDELVDPFTGSFKYNIPLLEIDGYPISLGYNGGVSMEDEASWVGLGWNLSPGMIHRNMRGIPDDFKGDEIKTETNMRSNVTVGIMPGMGNEIFGVDGFSGSIGINYNNYNGLGFETNVDLSRSILNSQSSFDVGLSNSSHDGLNVTTEASLKARTSQQNYNNVNIGSSIGSNFHSRRGMQSLSMNHTFENHSLNYFDINFAKPTYTPTISKEMKTSSYSFGLSIGGVIQGFEFTGDLAGHFTYQRLANNRESTPAYGYMYHDEGVSLKTDNDLDQPNVILDFNRENDGLFDENTPALPIADHTYDTYSISAEGLNESFRPSRSSPAYVFDLNRVSRSWGGSVGAEVALGSVVKAGVDVSANYTNSTSGKWTENNKLSLGKSIVKKPLGDNPNFIFNWPDSVLRPPLYESVFFKNTSENLPEHFQENFFSNMGGNNLLVPRIERHSSFNTGVTSELLEYSDNIVPDLNKMHASTNHKKFRERRNTAITFLTREELYASGIEMHEDVYEGEDHHIGEFQVTKPDGTRYIFGLPAYNTKKEEVTYNSSGLNVDYEEEKVAYNSEAASTENKRGRNHYYQSVETPPYPYAYKLTAILGPEYSDVQMNKRGPSSDDLGHYVDFNYDKTISEYKWRTPYNDAKHNQGLFSLNGDKQGNFTYGKKEIWYLDNIKTRNHVAVFHNEKRKDAHEVSGREGGYLHGNQSMHKLKKISLYSKPDYKKNKDDLDEAIPIKEVHFEYDYSLGKNVPNNMNHPSSGNDGKLTLKKVYFTYGNSNRGRLNSYEFSYSDKNPEYSSSKMNRWGDYSPKNVDVQDITKTSELPNSYFPYTGKNRNQANENVSAWLMDEIRKPTGGIINVEYEANDYAYVQNERAAEMFKIAKVTKDPNQPNLNNTGEKSTIFDYSNEEPGNYVFFELKEHKSLNYEVGDLINDYIDDKEYLYFKVLSELDEEMQEFVPGYAKFAKDSDGKIEAGLHEDNGVYTHGWIRTKTEEIENKIGSDQKVSPFQKAAIQFSRLHLEQQIFNQPDKFETFAEGEDFSDDLKNTVDYIKNLANSSMIGNFKELFQEPNETLFNNEVGYQIYNDRSWIKLKSPDKKKIGGGARVHKITVSDEWGEMSKDGASFQYGKEYDYTIKDPHTGKKISSGVAAYEPVLGGDENALRKPVYLPLKPENRLAAGGNNFLEEPFGESFFPSPQIGYSQVTVSDLSHENVTRRATGKSVHEFYTAKDFPVITRRSGLRIIPQHKVPIYDLFYSSTKAHKTTSQGFLIEKNDMHGKPKMITEYAEGKDNDQFVSRREYIYQKEKYKEDAYRLDNDVKTIYPDGSVQTERMGTDVEIVSDFREFHNVARSVAGQFNTANIFILVGTLPIPTFFASYQKSEERFRSATTTKIVNKKGILKEVREYDLGSHVSSENLAYDTYSGEPILTRSNNNFEDPVYTLKYPAYWFYKEMGPAYQNLHYSQELSFNSNGIANVDNPNTKYNVGDQLVFKGNFGVMDIWVTDITQDYIKAVNYTNQKIEDIEGEGKVVRPANRNMQKRTMGKIVSFDNPLQGLQSNTFTNVLEAEATTFTDDWDISCECFNELGNTVLSTDNPYVIGLRGNWLQDQQLAFLTERTLTHIDNQSNMREDGVYSSFTPFWKLKDGKWEKSPDNWVWESTISKVNAYGNAIEAKDPLERYSSELYGYNNREVTATISNSKHNEAGFDSFEDYEFSDCFDDHLSFKDNKELIVEDVSHTGLKSIKIEDRIHSRYYLIKCR